MAALKLWLWSARMYFKCYKLWLERILSLSCDLWGGTMPVSSSSDTQGVITSIEKNQNIKMETSRLKKHALAVMIIEIMGLETLPVSLCSCKSILFKRKNCSRYAD